MTTLNTKDGQLLLKDGKLQTDCGCCGGWYCVPSEGGNSDLGTCRYSGTLPETLRATVSIQLSSSIYGAVMVTGADGVWFDSSQNFDAPLAASWKMEPSDASAFSATYTLVRSSECTYQYPSSNINSGLNQTAIAVIVGQTSALLTSRNVSGLVSASCGACETSVAISLLNLTAYGKRSVEFYDRGFASQCSDQSCRECVVSQAAWTNATSRSYSRVVPLVISAPRYRTGDVLLDTQCSQLGKQSPRGRVNQGLTISLTNNAFDMPACQKSPLGLISHTWAFDLIYTDTSGSSHSEQTIHRALTFTLEQ